MKNRIPDKVKYPYYARLPKNTATSAYHIVAQNWVLWRTIGSNIVRSRGPFTIQLGNKVMIAKREK